MTCISLCPLVWQILIVLHSIYDGVALACRQSQYRAKEGRKYRRKGPPAVPHSSFDNKFTMSGRDEFIISRHGILLHNIFSIFLQPKTH